MGLPARTTRWAAQTNRRLGRPGEEQPHPRVEVARVAQQARQRERGDTERVVGGIDRCHGVDPRRPVLDEQIPRRADWKAA